MLDYRQRLSLVFSEAFKLSAGQEFNDDTPIGVVGDYMEEYGVGSDADAIKLAQRARAGLVRALRALPRPGTTESG